MNLIGDFGGGGMLLAFGILCALHETGRSGHGQVVDAAMAEGSALLAVMNWGFKAAGLWRNERSSNVNDGGAHFYAAYTCADGHCISIASAEPQFYALLRQKLGLQRPGFRCATRPPALAGTQGAARRDLQDQDPRRMVCVAGRH